MNHDVRMVFLDIDGTLVFQGQVVPSAVEAVRRLKENKIEVSLCTGRSRLHTQRVLDTLRLSQCIFFNGGLVERNGQILDESPLEEDVVLRMIDFFEEEQIPLILHTDSQAISLHPIPGRLRGLLDEYDYPEVQQKSLSDWQRDRPKTFQANMFCSQDWDLVIQNVLPECLLYRWESNGADLQRRGCDKSEGAMVLLKHLNIHPKQALHIGDGGNDIGMFRTMGLSIAMGNSHDDVKQHAKRVTSSVTEDGVYRALEELNLL